jgi:hypothetical protein
MSYGTIELKCPKCKKMHEVGEFGFLGEPMFTEDAMLGFKCSCGTKLVVEYDVRLVEYDGEIEDEDEDV